MGLALILVVIVVPVIAMIVYVKYDNLSEHQRGSLPPIGGLKTVGAVVLIILLAAYAYYFRITEQQLERFEGKVYYVGECRRIEPARLLPKWLPDLPGRFSSRRVPVYRQTIELSQNIYTKLTLELNCEEKALSNRAFGMSASALYMKETKAIFRLKINREVFFDKLSR